MKSRALGMILVIAFLMSFFVLKFAPKAVFNAYALALVVGVVVFFVLQSRKP